MTRAFAIRFYRGLAALITTMALLPSAAYGQAPQQTTPPIDTSFPVVPAILAVLATALILFVICVPSGKEEEQTDNSSPKSA